MSKVIVIGSFNVDHVWRCEALPVAGATLSGQYQSGPGGKGFNQAMAASRAGAHTRFICALGQDAGGKWAHALAEAESMDLAAENSSAPTGTAGIYVDQQGNNSIVIGAGANADLSTRFIATQTESIKSARVLLAQLESPQATIATGLALARQHQIISILNPAPANAFPSKELLELADILTPNETEFAALLNTRAEKTITAETVAEMDEAQLHALCRQISAQTVVITLGDCGVFVSHDPQRCHGDASAYYRLAAERAQVIDTTGAGDAFNGALAASLALAPRVMFADHVRFANHYAARSTETAGAALAMPRITPNWPSAGLSLLADMANDWWALNRKLFGVP